MLNFTCPFCGIEFKVVRHFLKEVSLSPHNCNVTYSLELPVIITLYYDNTGRLFSLKCDFTTSMEEFIKAYPDISYFFKSNVDGVNFAELNINCTQKNSVDDADVSFTFYRGDLNIISEDRLVLFDSEKYLCEICGYKSNVLKKPYESAVNHINSRHKRIRKKHRPVELEKSMKVFLDSQL